MGNFRTLRVWQDSLNFVTEIYSISRMEPFSRDFGLSGQIQRAAVSIASNIAEGDDRGSVKDSIRFFKMAKGSAAEVITQLHIAHRIKYIDKETLIAMEDQAEKLRASLIKLIKARSR